MNLADNSVQLTIGIPTMGRATLRKTIESVIDCCRLIDCNIEILVVHSGGDGPVGATHSEPPLHVKITHEWEPRPGFSHVRNRILDLCRSTRLAMVDDDEYVAIDWLFNGLQSLDLYDADMVTGPVDYRTTGTQSSWFEKNSPFKSAVLPDGKQLTVCSSNNLIIDFTRLDRSERFDLRFNATGGEDTDWTSRHSKSGAVIVWASDVCVVEELGSVRTTAKYARKRYIKNGKILHAIRAEHSSNLLLFGEGIARIGVGSMRMCGTFVMSTALPTKRRLYTYSESEGMLMRGLGLAVSACRKKSRIVGPRFVLEGTQS